MLSIDYNDDSGMFTLHSEQRFSQSPEQLFPFFADARNLEQLTPPLLKFSILGDAPDTIETGTLIRYRLRVHGLPLRWLTRITEWDPPHKFADEQLEGPYIRWYHVHEFRPTAQGTLMIDRVEHKLIGGRLAHRLFVKRDLYSIFEFRRQALETRFGSVS